MDEMPKIELLPFQQEIADSIRCVSVPYLPISGWQRRTQRPIGLIFLFYITILRDEEAIIELKKQRKLKAHLGLSNERIK